MFTQLRLHYSLAGTVKADVLLKLYEAIPRIDFTPVSYTHLDVYKRQTT